MPHAHAFLLLEVPQILQLLRGGRPPPCADGLPQREQRVAHRSLQPRGARVQLSTRGHEQSLER
jgi:hypothetical protein